MAKKRPGVMLYFDWLPSLQKLSLEEQGQLLMAVLTYAQTGKAPEFGDRLMDYAWAAIQPHIDADEQRYESVVQKRREAVSRRWEKESPSGTPSQRQESRPSPPSQRQERTYSARRSSVPSPFTQPEIRRDLRYDPEMDKYLDF